MNVEGPCATAIFRVFQEAFTNIIRHVQATKITVHLKQDQTDITLVVTDNGVGLEQGQILKPDAFGINRHARAHTTVRRNPHRSRPSWHGTTVATVVQ